MFQWLGLNAFTATGPGLIPGWETKIPQACQGGQKTNKKKALVVKEKKFSLKKKQEIFKNAHSNTLQINYLPIK